MVPRGEEKMEPPTRNVTIPMYVDLQIPEPIYVDYIRSYSDEFVTNTVTNAEGGVGLFIGAIQVEKEIQIEVELRSRRSEEHTSELQSRGHLVCRLLLEKKK